MNEEIKTFISKCDICKSVDPKQQRETLHPHNRASRPWAKGIPDIVISDNGPQFASQEFQHFRQKWGFEHKTSSRGYRQSNGKAESAVRTAKCLMLKAAAARQDLYLAMLDHRNTPSQGFNTCPAQRILSRRARTLLPKKDTLLKPEVTHKEQELEYNRQRQLSTTAAQQMTWTF
ncbi:uncharacterized protein K02A2.6-like [Gadus chalcogrammus]|uniref:uncharacterized protein K02A2.6-like n=1 Tax=Gadus chalcogrammus TaxID=1042646 RepID=UPI0024C49FC9|nr:uncharacterized protein K02A2.6-like [Gadus chalcogrammus]